MDAYGFHCVKFALEFALGLSIVLSKKFLQVYITPEDTRVVQIFKAIVGRPRTTWWMLQEGSLSLRVRKVLTIRIV